MVLVAERDLAVHAGPRGKALLKGNKIISPFSDDADLVLRVVRDLVPSDAELGSKLLILGHHYQQDEVIALSDLQGDSYQLSNLAAESRDCRYIAFCCTRRR